MDKGGQGSKAERSSTLPRIRPKTKRGQRLSLAQVSIPVEVMAEESRYILSKKIARGGMAEIYLGKSLGEDGFQRLCAIKRILPHFAQDQDFIQMFRDEAHICKRLQHANIVRVEGFEEVEGSFAIIMEYVDGPDLRTLLHALEQNTGQLPIPYACYIIAEAARGLHYAHTKIDEITQQPLGIVHRDISPQNILVSYEGEVKVTDFGIADAESKITETRPGTVKGKYSYMSPEQISSKTVDARTDVFALSIVLWEMLAMRRLFQGENEVETIQKVKNCKIDLELSELNKEIDSDLDTIVKRGLAKDLKKRYRSAGDFEKDLRRYMSRHFPDFTPEDLGSFLKKLMETRRHEIAADIKRTLTETNLRPGRRTSGANLSTSNTPSPEEKSKGRELDLSASDAKATGPALSLIRPIGGESNRTRSTTKPVPADKGRGLFAQNRGDGSRRPRNTEPPMSIVLPGLRRKHRRRLRPLLALATALVALMIGGKIWLNQFAEARPGFVVLRTQPPRVRIKLDGQELKQGAYLTASSKRPLQIPLKAGDHTITIGRAGYAPISFNFRLDSGGKLVKDDIVLKEKVSMAAVKVRAAAPDQVVQFDVNGGYFIGALVPRKIVSVPIDVQVGKSHQMRVSTKAISFMCTFTPNSTSWRQPNEVVIDVARRRCTMTGS